MKNVQIGQEGIREVEQVAPNATGDEVPTRTTRGLGLGAVACGAFALGPPRSVRSPSDVSPLAHSP